MFVGWNFLQLCITLYKTIIGQSLAPFWQITVCNALWGVQWSNFHQMSLKFKFFFIVWAAKIWSERTIGLKSQLFSTQEPRKLLYWQMSKPPLLWPFMSHYEFKEFSQHNQCIRFSLCNCCCLIIIVGWTMIHFISKFSAAEVIKK